MAPAIEIRRARGAEIVPYLGDLARLRVELFRGYPYLYDGDRTYEERYLRTYAESRASVVLLALADDVVVGASTGVPLAAEAAEARAPFEARGIAIDEIFYCGESLIEPTYRGRGIYARFLAGRETFAREAGFATCAFCAVDRGDAHLARPAAYRPLDTIWRRSGYERRADLVATYRWKDVGDVVETGKPMIFWLKSLVDARA